MVDLILVIVGVLLSALLASTSYAAVEYYRQLRRAQREYEQARDVVEDIVLSFNRELKREAEKIESTTSKMDGTAAKADAGLRKAETLENKVFPLELKVSQIGSKVEEIASTVEAISESNLKVVEKFSRMNASTIDEKMRDLESSTQKLAGVEAKVQVVEASQEALKAKISGIEEELKKISVGPELRTETPSFVPVMPIRRDKAMASLTETEIAVLEFLASDGPKTAPEIKDKVQLSREHTARLMKKLYEEGYLERETGKLPFKYSVKKEMEKLLRKTETQGVQSDT